MFSKGTQPFDFIKPSVNCRIMIKNSVVKIQNLVVNHKSQPVKSNSVIACTLTCGCLH